MSERRRLLGGGAEVEIRGFDLYEVATGKMLVAVVLGDEWHALTEPIPEEEATGEEKDTEFAPNGMPWPIIHEAKPEEPQGKEKKVSHYDDMPVVGSAYSRDTHFTSQWNTGKPDADGFIWEKFPKEDPRMEEMEKRIATLEERMEEQRQEVTITLPPVQIPSPTPAPEQNPAGGDEPSAEEVLKWLEGGAGQFFANDRRITRRLDTAARLIRAGQQDTRPVLTEHLIHRAASNSFLHAPEGYTARKWYAVMEAALLSTGAFREVSDAT